MKDFKSVYVDLRYYRGNALKTSWNKYLERKPAEVVVRIDLPITEW